jgi:hypothetical protein
VIMKIDDNNAALFENIFDTVGEWEYKIINNITYKKEIWTFRSWKSREGKRSWGT